MGAVAEAGLEIAADEVEEGVGRGCLRGRGLSNRSRAEGWLLDCRLNGSKEDAAVVLPLLLLKFALIDLEVCAASADSSIVEVLTGTSDALPANEAMPVALGGALLLAVELPAGLPRTGGGSSNISSIERTGGALVVADSDDADGAEEVLRPGRAGA